MEGGYPSASVHGLRFGDGSMYYCIALHCIDYKSIILILKLKTNLIFF